MSNQPQFRPWFRLATLARASQPQTPAPTSEPRPSQPQTSAPTQAPRPSQPQTPTPTPAPRPQTQPPAPSMPRPGPAQEAAPRAPAPTTSAPAPPPPSATSAAPPARAAPSPAPATTTSAPRAPASIPAAAAQPPAPAIRSPPAVTRTPTPAPPVSQKPPPTSSMPSPPQPPSFSSPPPLVATSRSVPPSPPPATSRSVPPSTSSPPKAVTPPKVPAFSLPKPSARETIAPSMPTSPPKPSNGSSVTARVPTPTESPRAAKPVPETPPQSPKEKASHPPRSPFALPPSQLKPEGETEKKTVLVQQTAGKPKPYLEPQGVDVGSHKPRDGMHVKPKDRHLYKTSSDSEDRGMRVITISGENKGAVMELGNLPRRRGTSSNSPAPHKLKSDGGKLSEGNLSRKEEKPKLQGRDHNAAPKSSAPMHAFTNSNVQGINSSVVYNSRLSHHDPGVHLSVTRKPLNGHDHGHGFQLKGNASEKNTQKEKGLRFSE